MFTGIIESAGVIESARPTATGRRLRVRVGDWAAECALGASVAVSGACLTVCRIDVPSLEFDVIHETLRKTTLGERQVGDRVNLERSLRVGDRLDGHFVQGHVDGTATVDRVERRDGGWETWFRPPDELVPFIVGKGSVAIDGVSLTVAAVDGPRFSVALIPTTLEITTLAKLQPGDRVNLETDMLARCIAHQLAGLGEGSGLTLDQLRKAGMA